MAIAEVTYVAAIGAGLLSFLSPCVLPLVPSYLCFLGGVSLEELTADTRNASDSEAAALDRARSRRVVLAALAFVAGFSVVFVSLGATASAVSGFLLQNKEWLAKAAGVLIIIFGLHLLGIFRISFLNQELRGHVAARPAGLIGAFFIGLAFAFGWTPCIGPVLATILSVAASRDSIGFGTSLLGAYAFGLGIPFVIAALAARPFMAWLTRARRYVRLVELATGGLLIVTGLAFVFSWFEIFGYWLIETFPVLGTIG